MYCGLTSMPESVRRVVSSAIGRWYRRASLRPPARTGGSGWGDASTLARGRGRAPPRRVRQQRHRRPGRLARRPPRRPAGGPGGRGRVGGSPRPPSSARPDLPGWTSTARRRRRGDEIKELARGIPGCEQFVAGIRDGLVRTVGKFTRNGTTVDGDVDVYATAADLQAQLELYRDPGIVDCLQNLFTKALQSTAPAGATVENVSVSPIAVEDVGDGPTGSGSPRRSRATARRRRSSPTSSASPSVASACRSPSPRPTPLRSRQVETTLLPIMAQRVHDAGG